MAAVINKSQQWREQISQLAEVSEDALGIVRRLQCQAEENGKVQASLRSLSKQLEEIRNTASNIHQTTCRAPAEKLLAGTTMIEAEYFFLRAVGCHLFTAKNLGLSPVDDYEVHRNLCYVDNERFCYINPQIKPQDANSKEGVLRIGLPPEELKFRNLLPEQRSFFEQYMPEVPQRFKVD